MNPSDYHTRVQPTTEQLELAHRLRKSFEQNIEILSENIKLKQRKPLRIWAVFLGILALENFDSIILLVSKEKYRSTFIMLRSLVDYHIRLRYYIQQGIRALDKWEELKIKDTSHFENEVHAIRDYKNQKTKGASLLHFHIKRTNDEEYIQVKNEMEEILSLDKTIYANNFGDMIDFLKENDVPKKENYYEWMRSIWKWESCFSHGDQAVMSYAITFDKETYQVHMESPSAFYHAILAEACYLMLEIMDSFGRINGFVYDLNQGQIEAARAFKNLSSQSKKAL